MADFHKISDLSLRIYGKAVWVMMVGLDVELSVIYKIVPPLLVIVVVSFTLIIIWPSKIAFSMKKALRIMVLQGNYVLTQIPQPIETFEHVY